jgi:hypothetical protein
VVWSEPRAGAGPDVFFRASRDRGETWSGVARLNTNAAGGSASLRPRICGDGSYVYVSWMDNRNGGHQPYFNRSADGGRTWLAGDVRVNTTPPGSLPALVSRTRPLCRGSIVHLAWTDPRNGNGPEVWLNRSTNGGASFETVDVRLTGERGTGVVRTHDPSVWCNGSGAVHVAWADDRNAGRFDVFVNASDDGGRAWLPAELRLDTDLPGAGNSTFPDLCGSGAFFYVVWQDDRSAAAPLGGFDVRFNRNVP